MDIQKLYLMKNEVDLYKVGISNNPSKRAAQISNSSGLKVDIIKTWDVYNAYELEQKIHAEFKSKRKKGEWFKFTNKDLPKLEKYIKNNFAKINLVEVEYITDCLCGEDPYKQNVERYLKYSVSTEKDIDTILRKQAKALNIYLEAKGKETYLNLIKDLEDNGYSIPWRMKNTLGNVNMIHTNGSSIFTKEMPIYKGELQKLEIEYAYEREKELAFTLELENTIKRRLELESKLRELKIT